MKHAEIIASSTELATIQVCNQTHVVRPYHTTKEKRDTPNYNGRNYMLCGIIDRKDRSRRNLEAFRKTWIAQQKVTSKQIYNR